jgi:hypothetical protein
VAAQLAAVPAALAGNPDYRSVIERVTPPVPGVSFRVLEYDSFIELRDRGHLVVIGGYNGEPYARVLPDGRVQVNRRAPATYLNVSFFATAKVPAIANPAAPPLWKTESSAGVFVWHDHRMHYMSASTPPQVTDTQRRTKIFDYRIPLRIDGRAGAIDGTLFWVGSPSASRLPLILASAVVVLAALGLILRARSRRHRDDEPGAAW